VLCAQSDVAKRWHARTGTATQINVDVSEYLAAFQDPIKAILGEPPRHANSVDARNAARVATVRVN